MLMGKSGREAKVRYQDGTFTLLSHGDHVVCAVTGRAIPLGDLRYWSVERQEAYVSADCVLKAARTQ